MADQTAKDILASWFTASEIRLNDDALPDLVVLPVNPCLFGANINPFWVFRRTTRGYRLALSISTLGLEVLKSRSKGYHNIRATAATAREYVDTVYSFDGSAYRAGRTRRHAIR